MDGGGRLLRSIEEADLGFLAEARPRFGWLPRLWSRGAAPAAARSRAGRPHRPLRLPRRGLGLVLLAALFGGTGLYGSIRGGEYEAFVAEYGSPTDVVARALGFPIDAVSISGIAELSPDQILAGGGVGPKESLALLDPAGVRERLRRIPLVKDATVRKLFPDRLAIAVVEREPAGLWQRDGRLALIAGDGVTIDEVRDDRFNDLPFVVGAGANQHLPDYLNLLAAAGDLHDRVTAGIYVGERRWTLKLDPGVDVELPETGAADALRRFVDLERQYKVLEKDVIAIDLRIPGRMTVRLSEDAAAQRAAMLAKKNKKASPT